MSKNLTRKGLALGALVALTSTAFAGTPAMAAGELIVAPSAGTSYATLVTETFNLKTSFAPGSTPSSYAQLKYQVKTDGVASIKANVNTGEAVTAAGATAATAFSGNSNNTYVISASRALVGTGAGSAYAANDPGAAVSSTTQNFIGLQVASATVTTATTSVEVTAFVDANNDGALTAGEWNAAQTVTFKKLSEIAPTVSLTAPATGDTAVKATAVWAGINVEQISNETVKFTVGSQVGSATAGTLADGVWTLGSLTALAASEAVTAQAYFGTNAAGTAVSATAAARTINTTNGLVSNVLAGNDSVATAATAIATNTAATVRTNGTFTAQVKALDTATTPVAKSGVAVVATIATSATLSATSGSVVSITANGVTYNTAAALSAASIALTTDASGVANVTISTAGFVDGKTVTVTFKAQNLTSAVVATADDATYTVVSTGVGSALRSIVEGGSTTFNYAVKDQYGVVIGSGARLKFEVGYTTAATTYVPLSNGAASITVTDTTASTDADITVDATLQTQDVATGNWAVLSPSVTAAQQTVNVHSAAVAFDTDPASSGAVNISTNATLTASVNNAGAAVTVAAKGVAFTVGGVEYADSVTLFSAANGDVSVSAKSNIAGSHTVTFTSGAVSKTVALVVNAVAANSGVTLSITAPSMVKSGKTVVVTAKLVDKYGNPVAVPNTNASSPTTTVTYDGPGFVTSSIAQTLDASGVSTFRVLLASNDTGAATVTFTYDADGTGTASAVVTKTATILVGVSASVSAGSKKANVVVKNAAGLTVKVVSGSKSTTKIATSDSYKVSLSKLTAGKKTVKVYVEGVLVSSKSVTVKR